MELEQDMRVAAEAALRAGNALYVELEERLAKLRSEGLKDLKMKVFVDPETSSASIIKVLNNGLRLREERKLRGVRRQVARLSI
jgi:hypothetical protein